VAKKRFLQKFTNRHSATSDRAGKNCEISKEKGQEKLKPNLKRIVLT
jgi:hypothetical protein